MFDVLLILMFDFLVDLFDSRFYFCIWLLFCNWCSSLITLFSFFPFFPFWLLCLISMPSLILTVVLFVMFHFSIWFPLAVVFLLLVLFLIFILMFFWLLFSFLISDVLFYFDWDLWFLFWFRCLISVFYRLRPFAFNCWFPF